MKFEYVPAFTPAEREEMFAEFMVGQKLSGLRPDVAETTREIARKLLKENDELFDKALFGEESTDADEKGDA